MIRITRAKHESISLIPLISNRSSEEPFVTLDLENMYQEQLINSNESMTIIPAINRYENVYSRILLLKLNGTIQHIVFSMVKDVASESLEFSGKIYLTTLDGDYINAYKVVDGVAVSRYKKPEDKLSEGVYARPSDGECRGIACGMEGDEVVVYGKGKGSGWIDDEEKSDSWFDIDDGGGGGEGWDYGPGEGGGGTSGGPVAPSCGTGYVRDAYGNCVLKEVEIINNLTNLCAKTIFSQLEIEMLKKEWKEKLMNPTPNVSRTFSESILKLFNESKSVHLTIANGDLKGTNGTTFRTSITISDTYLENATQLSIVRTMIHEMTHAYINTLFYDYKDFDSMDFRQKLVEYAKVNGYGSDWQRSHHEFMGQYVDAMAASLLIWDEKHGSKTNLGWEYYRAMAFGGLRYWDSKGNNVDTDSFIALVPKTSDRDKIKIIINNENDGNNSAKGKKCN